MIGVFKALFNVILMDKSSLKFALGVLLGLGFSMAVILSTIGIMDGFDSSLKIGLNRSTGDLTFYSKKGFFDFKKEVRDKLNKLGIDSFSSFVRSEGFMIKEQKSKGVLVKGVEERSFRKVTGLKIGDFKDGIMVGAELASHLDIEIDDEVILAFAVGNEEFGGLPHLKRFKVKQIIKHGIYQKDLRFVYMERAQLQKMLRVGNKVNLVSLKIPNNQGLDANNSRFTEVVTDYKYRLMDILGMDYTVRPFWKEYSILFEAVKIQKVTISLILQLIVVIAVFNVLAFVIFINEQRSRELFLIKALGLSQGKLLKTWLGIVFLGWILASFVSILLVKIFNLLLHYLPIFQLPGEIYYLGRLSILLTPIDYSTVFIATLGWLLIISWIGLIRLKRKSILYGLRREFA